MKAKPSSAVDPILHTFREASVLHPFLLNVDHYRQAGSDLTVIESQWITGDPGDDKYIKTNTLSCFSHSQEKTLTHVASTVEHDAVTLQKYSPSGTYKAVLKSAAAGSLIEIYKAGVLYQKKLVPLTTHAGFVRTPVLVSKSLQFSEDEQRFMYMAEDPVIGMSV